MTIRFTRRKFLASAAALPLALRGMAEGVAPSATAKHILIGTLDGQGIGRMTWNAATGELGPLELAAATTSPTYMALHPKLPIVYAVNERAKGDGSISSFGLDRERASLLQINSIGTAGNGPAYISLDQTGSAAFVADYGGGKVVCAPLTTEGDFLPITGVFGNPQTQHGPVTARQDAAHMHCTVVSPDNQFLLVCDLGNDAILIFRILPGQPATVHAAATPMSLSQVTLVPTRPGAGPRHVKFHPNGRWVYCINELDCTVDLFDWNASEVSLIRRQGASISTLATRNHLTGSWACMVVYRIDPKSGLLKPQQRLEVGGKAARYFAFDPTRRWLLCANQDSNTIGVFAHDPMTGHIMPTPKLVTAPTPMFVLFL